MKELIKQLVIDKTGLDIEKHTRKQKYIEAKSMYYSLCRKYTRDSYREIGASMNFKKDSATVLHSCKMLETYLTYSKLNRDVYKKMSDIILYYTVNNCDDLKHAESFITVDTSLYSELIEVVYTVPVNHIETVKERLETIIKCLPKN